MPGVGAVPEEEGKVMRRATEPGRGGRRRTADAWRRGPPDRPAPDETVLDAPRREANLGQATTRSHLMTSQCP